MNLDINRLKLSREMLMGNLQLSKVISKKRKRSILKGAEMQIASSSIMAGKSLVEEVGELSYEITVIQKEKSNEVVDSLHNKKMDTDFLPSDVIPKKGLTATGDGMFTDPARLVMSTEKCTMENIPFAEMDEVKGFFRKSVFDVTEFGMSF